MCAQSYLPDVSPGTKTDVFSTFNCLSGICRPHLPHMEQGLCKGKESVHLSLSACLSVCPSVCPIPPPHIAAAALLLWARRAGDTDRLLHAQPALSSSRGAQQQMRAVPRCQLTKEASRT